MSIPAAVRSWKFDQSAFTVGPVVGLVTEREARILVETSRDVHGKVEATLNGKTVCSVLVNFQGKKPTVVVVNGLNDNSAVVVSVALDAEVRQATFRTPSVKTEWRIAAVSCNDVKKFRQIHLWEKLADEAGTIDLCLHMGDQIYGDETYFRSVNASAEIDTKPEAMASAYGQAMALVSRASPATFPSYSEQVKEFYRDIYRQTWGDPRVAAALASMSNLFVMDDHEVVDDLGDLDSHHDPKSWEYFAIQCAYQVYLEYQLQLQRPVDVTDTSVKSYSQFTVGGPQGLGIFMMDTRIERSIHKGKDKEGRDFLGSTQWKAMEDALSVDFAKSRALLIVSPVPPLFLNSVATTLAGKISNDVRGSWGASRYRKEQIDFLKLLSGWQAAKPDRMVCILAGDVHVGGFSDVQVVNDAPLLNQFVSSAIGNSPEAELGIAAKGVMEFNELDTKLKIEHHEWIMHPNYGTLSISLEGKGAGKPPVMRGTLVSEKKIANHRMRYRFGEIEEATTSPGFLCGCSVM